MRKRVAILTFQGADSYGAQLQAFALKRHIEELECEVEIVNYNCIAIKREYGFPKSPKRLIGRILRTPAYQIRRARFNQFREQFLELGQEVSYDKLAEYTKQADIVVVGSDQVWNPDITNNDPSFFLDFCSPSTKRVAYAASIGSRQWSPENEAKHLKYLRRFSKISVREKTTSCYLENLGIPSVVSCDPTLLFSSGEWRTLLKIEEQKVEHPYVLLVCLQNPFPESVELAFKVANIMGCEVKVLHTGRKIVKGAINIITADPIDFVRLIDGASFVISESFHVCCFSIQFRKNFFYFDPRTTGSSRSRSVRITDLLNQAGLSDRALSTNYSNDLNITVDYDECTSNLAHFIAESRRFLVDSVLSD